MAKKEPITPGTILKKEMSYLNGNLHGSFKFYSPDSVLLDDLNFDNGKKDGNLKYFYNDGTLLKTENWDVGVKNGLFQNLSTFKDICRRKNRTKKENEKVNS